ncbi:UNVERIFIED_CONTAM: hypothetical protein RKD50_000020 [Streptomyces canus]
MTDEHVPATYRRRLVVIAVSDYDDGTPTQRAAFQDAINAQVTVVDNWWNSPHLDDQRRFTPSHPPKPLHSVHDLRAFLIDEDLIQAHDDDALVIYLTGHGLAPDDERHFLRLPDTHTERPLGTAFPTAELITAALDSPAEYVLVMVDSCFSGRLTQELDRTLKALHPDRHALSSLVVLTAGNEDSTPQLRAFTTALAAVQAHCADEANGYARSHLSWEDFHAILGTVWDATCMADVQVLWPPQSVSRRLAARELSPCLPNPGHTDTTLLEDARSQLGWTRRDIDAYWIDKATGQMSSDTGWYFTGRTALVARMNAFLAGSDSTLIVTGQAGSGKSALLARLVTLSDPRFCNDPTYRPYLQEIPEELRVTTGAIDAAVLARNTDPQELHAALYQALTGQSAPTDENTSDLLHQHAHTVLTRTNQPLTVVVDGIDEAKNPRRVITDVLRPLAGLRSRGRPAVRLILGIRSSLPASRHTLADQGTRTERDLLDLLREATGALDPLRTDDDSAEDDIARLRGSPAARPLRRRKIAGPPQQPRHRGYRRRHRPRGHPLLPGRPARGPAAPCPHRAARALRSPMAPPTAGGNPGTTAPRPRGRRPAHPHAPGRPPGRTACHSLRSGGRDALGTGMASCRPRPGTRLRRPRCLHPRAARQPPDRLPDDRCRRRPDRLPAHP